MSEERDALEAQGDFVRDSLGRTIKVFNRDCIVCNEPFKAKSKTHKKCNRCKHMSVNDAEEQKQVAYQEGRFGINELDDLGEEETFDDDNYEEDTGYSQQEIYEMFSEQDEDPYLEEEWE